MEGFIPQSRGSFMLDLVAVAMFAVLPALAFGIHLVKDKLNYAAHKKVMLTISATLAVAVILFELEMRLVGWRDLAAPSPYYDTLMPFALGIHLVCSISTVGALIATVWFAVRGFPIPPIPGAHSPQHKKLGKLSALGLFLTSITGWIFYYLAFIAA
jgi:putative membrane protein